MLEAAAQSHRGRVRSHNEDYWLIDPDIGLYLVADGMGGAQAGEHASHLAAGAVAEAVRASKTRTPDTLRLALEAANSRVAAAAVQNPDLAGMGTTLVAVLEDGGELSIASVGDSRAYLVADHTICLITRDQTWVEEIGRPLGLRDDELRTHPMRHVLTMAIGTGPSLRIQTHRLSPRTGQQILLSSDGLHGVVDEKTLLSITDSQRTLAAKCHYLIDAALRAGGPDNITAVLLRVA